MSFRKKYIVPIAGANAIFAANASWSSSGSIREKTANSSVLVTVRCAIADAFRFRHQVGAARELLLILFITQYYVYGYPGTSSTPVCTLDQVSCWTEVLSNSVHGLLSLNQTWPCDCLPACDEITYSMRTRKIVGNLVPSKLVYSLP